MGSITSHSLNAGNISVHLGASLKLLTIQFTLFRASLDRRHSSIPVRHLQWTDSTISRSSLLLRRPKENEQKSVRRDGKRNIGIATITDARDRQTGVIVIETIETTGKGPKTETAIEAGTIARGSTIQMRMVTDISGLDTRNETTTATLGGTDTDTGTESRLEMKSQTLLHLQMLKRSFPYQTKSYPETKPRLSRGTPG